MKRKCYWCSKDMGLKDGNGQMGVFYSICDDCYSKMGLEERMPDLILDIVALRGNSGKVQPQAVGVLSLA